MMNNFNSIQSNPELFEYVEFIEVNGETTRQVLDNIGSKKTEFTFIKENMSRYIIGTKTNSSNGSKSLNPNISWYNQFNKSGEIQISKLPLMLLGGISSDIEEAHKNAGSFSPLIKLELEYMHRLVSAYVKMKIASGEF